MTSCAASLTKVIKEFKERFVSEHQLASEGERVSSVAG